MQGLPYLSSPNASAEVYKNGLDTNNGPIDGRLDET